MPSLSGASVKAALLQQRRTRERVETDAAYRSVKRRFGVSCAGGRDIFQLSSAVRAPELQSDRSWRDASDSSYDPVSSMTTKDVSTLMQQGLVATQDAWVSAVLGDFDAFLLDHAACERKASAMAMTFVVRYPDRDAILDPMIRLAKEELAHFHQVFRICQQRGLRFSHDTKDPYVNALLSQIRRGREVEFLDRLVMAGVVEARGHERFGRVADALEPGELKDFYRQITLSEARHCELFFDLAKVYFEAEEVAQRIAFFLDRDSDAIAAIAPRPALH